VGDVCPRPGPHAVSVRSRVTARRCGLVVALVGVVAAAGVAGVPLQPGGESARAQVPLPPSVRSALTIDDGVVVSQAPREGAARRGLVERGTRLPVRRRVLGTGCSPGAWLDVGVDAWVCERFVELSSAPPAGVPQPDVAPGATLPYRYAFVATDGTRAYSRPSDYDADNYAEAFGEGFGLALTGHTVYDGVGFARTNRGLWVPEDSLRFARGTSFAGVALAPGAPLDLAWVTRPRTTIRGPARRQTRNAARFDVLHVASAARAQLVLADGGSIAARDATRVALTAPPDGVGASDRWVDVDIATQTLVAYEGTRPVFATLVSTGRALPDHETPLGVHHVWVKLATSNMDDLEREDVERNYSIENVPWVQYFEHSNGFHAAFWHEDFGHRRSHGCVNLSPRDARWLFDFTRPSLPPGWTAVFPTEHDPATVVRVR